VNLIDLKPARQREVIKLLGERLAEMSDESYWSDDDVETVLGILQAHLLDELGQDDFFGTEGWEHWLEID